MMVRTYAFNPSTQNSASLPGAREREEFPQQAPIPSQTLPDISPTQTVPYLPFPLELQNQPLDASFSTTSSTNSSGPTMVEGSFTVLGIRTVLIDGQPYYQPLDSELQRLINQQVDVRSIVRHGGSVNSSNSSNFSPPPDPGPMRNGQLGNPAMIATMHMAAVQSMSGNSVGLSHSYPGVSQLHGVQKPFSEYDPAIRKNVVGLPTIHPDKCVAAAMNNMIMANVQMNPPKNNDNKAEMIDDLPPWARGNPQPRSGKRGTIDWSKGQLTNGTSVLPSASTLYFNKPPMPSSEASHPHGSQSLLSSFGSTLARALPLPRHNHPPPTELYRSFASSYHNPLDAPQVHYPVQQSNSYGSFYSEPNPSTSFIAAPLKYVNPFPPGHEKYEKEQHKLELLQQIEDNRRRKEMEKQREWEIEERERIRSEIFAARQRAEVEEEQRRAKEQAIAAERKAARLAESNTALLPNKNQARRPSVSRPKNGRRGSTTSQQSANGGLEWWEKKKTWEEREERGKSPMIPTLATKRNSEQNLVQAPVPSVTNSASLIRRSPSPMAMRQRSASQVPPQSPMRPPSPPRMQGSRGSMSSAKQDRSSSRVSRRSYQPTIASRQGNRLDDSLRNLSATRRQLDDEQKRVKEALDNNEYGRHVFD